MWYNGDNNNKGGLPMKRAFKSRVLSAVLTCTMLLTTPIGSVRAAAEDTGKYVSEVFIA